MARSLTLFYDDFATFSPGSSTSPFQYVSNPFQGLILSDDATGGFSSGSEGLEVRSTPFTFSTDLGSDHTKFFVIVKHPFEVNYPGETIFEGIMSAQQTGLELLPPILQDDVTNAQSDIRLATGGFIVNDAETSMVYNFGLTNETIYAYYERSPNARKEWGGSLPPYQATSHSIPVGKRNVADPLNDYVKLAIALSYTENYVRWLVNDVEVLRINRLGYPYDRQHRILESDLVVDGKLVVPSVSLQRSTSVIFGLGTFNLMDAYDQAKASNRGLVNTNGTLTQTYSDPQKTSYLGEPLLPTYASSYPLPGQSGSNFGQGCIIRFKYLTAYRRGCYPELYSCCECILWSRCQQNVLAGVNASEVVKKVKCKGKLSSIKICEKYSRLY